MIDSLRILLDESQQRNFTRWPILSTYVWPNAYIGNTYQNEINYLKNWIVNRFNWMDEELSPLVDVPDQQDMPEDYFLSQNYPNPFNPSNKNKILNPLSHASGAKNVNWLFSKFTMFSEGK